MKFFKEHKRRIIQLFCALAYNANLSGFVQGRIYKGDTKGLCVPGLNCYSCPGAVAACPIGSLQAALAGSHSMLFYVVGCLLLFGVLFGRMVCGYLCPFGLVQDLIDKIPLPKLKKSPATRLLSHLKYVVLAVLVVAVPVVYAAQNGIPLPAFCKYLCPAGTLGGGIPLSLVNQQIAAQTGAMFDWKVVVLAVIAISSAFIYRPFCRFLCPLGAIYSLFNRYAVFGVRVDDSKCTSCGACVRHCKLDVKRVNDRECIRCGECKKVCPTKAIYTASPKTYAAKYRSKKLKINKDI